jgi:hypothetical protein
MPSIYVLPPDGILTRRKILELVEERNVVYDWKRIRLLLIGFHKSDSINCVLAIIPKEIIVEISKFLYHHEPAMKDSVPAMCSASGISWNYPNKIPTYSDIRFDQLYLDDKPGIYKTWEETKKKWTEEGLDKIIRFHRAIMIGKYNINCLRLWGKYDPPLEKFVALINIMKKHGWIILALYEMKYLNNELILSDSDNYWEKIKPEELPEWALPGWQYKKNKKRKTPYSVND